MIKQGVSSREAYVGEMMACMKVLIDEFGT